MSPSPDILSPNTIHFDKVETFSLGFKELLFLGFTLFIGFYGFSICVDKIYVTDIDHIESITVHDQMISHRNPKTVAKSSLVSN